MESQVIEYDLEVARLRFVFLRRLEEKHFLEGARITAFNINDEFRSKSPFNMENKRLTVKGSATWHLYLVKEDDIPQEVDMKFGLDIVYPARNFSSDCAPGPEYPDDVHEPGETISQALDRQNLKGVKYVVLYGVGINSSACSPSDTSGTFHVLEVAEVI